MKHGNLVGRAFGRWRVLERVTNSHKKGRYLARCSCGNVRVVFADALVRGLSASCGCARDEWLAAERIANPTPRDACGRFTA